MDEKRRMILDQALRLADERGLAAVSMRAVAARIGLTSMALYPYVGNKEALLDGLVDLLRSRLPAVDDGGHWADRLRAVARATRALAREHPGAYPLLLTRASGGAELPGVAAALRDAGVPTADVARLERLLSGFVLGFTTCEVTGRFSAADCDDEFEADLDDLVRLVAVTAGATAPV